VHISWGAFVIEHNPQASNFFEQKVLQFLSLRARAHTGNFDNIEQKALHVLSASPQPVHVYACVRVRVRALVRVHDLVRAWLEIPSAAFA